MLTNFSGVKVWRTVSNFRKNFKTRCVVFTSFISHNVKLGSFTSKSWTTAKHMHKSVMHVRSFDSFLLSRLRLPPSSLISTICGPLINEPKLEQFVEQYRWTQIHKYVTTQWFQVTDKLALKFIRLLLKNGLLDSCITTYVACPCCVFQGLLGQRI